MDFSLENIARQFFRIEQWLGAQPLGNGNINDTYRIDFQEDSALRTAVLQRLNHRVFRQPEAVMRNWQAVAEHLLRADDFPLQIPVPQPTLDGQLLHFDAVGAGEEPNCWRAFPFFENTFAPETAATPDVAREAARAYGIFLRALGDFPAEALAETIPGFHDTDRRWAVFQEILAKDPAGRLAGTAAEVTEMEAALPIFQEISRLKTSGALPLRATHNDTKAGNVLLDSRAGRAVAVIDWDTIMPGTALSDFGDMMRSFAPDRPESAPDVADLSLRLDVVEAMCRSFLAETRHFLTPIERANLFLGGQWLIGEQALRFLTDYLAGDVYYKVAHPTHNLARARNQLALLRRVTEAEAQIRRFLA